MHAEEIPITEKGEEEKVHTRELVMKILFT